MSQEELHDRLVDVLLEELVGGVSVPDVRDAVLRRWQRLWMGRVVAGISVAAAVLLGLFMTLTLLKPHYPQPNIEGDYTVVSGEEFGRGATIKVGYKPVHIALGGYCVLTAEPDSVLRLEGRPFREAVFLKEGKVICAVRQKIGALTVRTAVGEVRSKGTEFVVNVSRLEGDVMRMGVKVLTGVVVVSAAVLAAPLVLQAGDEGEFGKPHLPDRMKGFCGILQGKVVAKTKYGFVLKVEKVVKQWKQSKAKDASSAVGKRLLINVQWAKGVDGKWRPVPMHMAFLRTLKVGQRIKIEVINDEGERLHILELGGRQRKQARRGGVVVGILVAKEGDDWIDVKVDGVVERYFVPSANEVGADVRRCIARAVVGLIVSNLVEVKWRLGENDKRIVVGVKILMPRRKSGTLTGRVVDKGDTWIEVKPEGKGVVERYMPRWVGGAPKEGGGFDKEMLRKIGDVRVGDKVKVRWIYDERKRVVGLKIIAHAKRKHKKEGERKEHKQEKRPKEKRGDLPKEGRLLGRVVKTGERKLTVKVIETAKGCEALKGETITFWVNWIKQGGRWIPDPEQVRLFTSVKEGMKVEISFYYDGEHWRVRTLEIEHP